MYLRSITLILVLWFSCTLALLRAQETTQLSADEIKTYAEQSKQLIHFFEGSLNFLGDPAELASEKDIVINDSYAKYFKDDEVQIEDDLDDNRETPLNKDVQAYLKDVDFFFKEVKFRFEVTDVEQLVNDFGQLYFKLTVDRHLTGITVNEDTLDNNQVRYFEINLDHYRKDLKIASVYTTKLNAKESLRYWWANMPDTWRDFFGSPQLVFDTLPFNTVMSFSDSSMVVKRWVPLIQADTFLVVNQDTLLLMSHKELWNDSVSFYVHTDTLFRELPDTIAANTETLYFQLQSFKNMKAVDVSNNMMLGNLNPLSELTELESLDFSNTLIDDLTPLRNLNKLASINCSGSPLTSLEPLRYMSSLKALDASKTMLMNIDVMANFRNLESLNLSHTKINSLEALAHLESLQQLNVAATAIQSCEPLRELKHLTDLNVSHTNMTRLNSVGYLLSLEHLNIDSTKVSDLEPLSEVKQLKVLQANATSIGNLDPLLSLEKLRFVYCDHSNIDQNTAQQFMEKNSGCLVVYNTEDLFDWWNSLGAQWQQALKKQITSGSEITTEDLHQIIMISSLDLKYKPFVTSLAPLSMLHRLEWLNVEHTPIIGIEEISGLSNIRYFNIDGTQVSDLSVLANWPHLSRLHIEKTAVSNLSPLNNNKQLEYIYCNKSAVKAEAVYAFKPKQPQCLVIYQSDALSLWWEALDEDWQKVFREQLDLADAPSREQLQELVNLDELLIENSLGIRHLDVVRPFHWLKTLQLNNTAVSDISPLFKHQYLRELMLPNNPIADLTGIDALKELQHLNLENTSVSDIQILENLSGLKRLNLAGTKIKNLKYLSGLQELESLQISNTKVRSLKPIMGLKHLQELRCHNTGLNSSKVNSFKAANPQIEVIFY